MDSNHYQFATKVLSHCLKTFVATPINFCRIATKVLTRSLENGKTMAHNSFLAYEISRKQVLNYAPLLRYNLKGALPNTIHRLNEILIGFYAPSSHEHKHGGNKRKTCHKIHVEIAH